MSGLPPHITLSDDPVPELSGFNSGEWGAEVIFLGRVRGTEDGRAISGIRYTAYPEMALKVMQQIVSEMQAAHGDHPIRIHHRLGFVATGEPSILIAAGGKHSRETWDRSQEYLRRIKTEVPIWKEPVFEQSQG